MANMAMGGRCQCHGQWLRVHGDNEDDGDDSITDVEFPYSLRCSSFLGFNQIYTQDPIKVTPKRNFNGDYR